MNNVSLIGRLTADPDYRSGKEADVVNFTLAVDRFGNDTDFIPVKAFNKTADFVDDYFRKGLRVGVVGRIQVQNYDDKDGNPRTYTCVIANSVFFADAKSDTKEDDDAQKDDKKSKSRGKKDDNNRDDKGNNRKNNRANRR